MSSQPPWTDPGRTAAQRVLPAALLDLALAQLDVSEDVATRLGARDLLTVRDALEADVELVSDEDAAALRTALQDALDDGLRRFGAPTSNDWPTLQAQLLGPLDDQDRRLLLATVGLGEPPQSRRALQQLLGDAELEDRLQRVRATLLRRCAGLLGRLEDELHGEFAAGDGVLLPGHAAADTLVQVLGAACGDPEVGLRLAAFCLPHRCHLHRGALHGVSPRRFRELMRALPTLAPQHLLPMPLAQIRDRLREQGTETPAGVLAHVLRTELRTAIELDADQGEVAVPDPRKPAARLQELLNELGAPATIQDLTFGYRERFRFASRARLLRHLSDDAAFVRLGPDRWSLRRWHEGELGEAAELIEQTARRIAAAEQRLDVIALLEAEHGADKAWLVLDQLRHDPRVRALGRGEACAADLPQSTVMKRLQRAFRRAAGDVVKSRFVQNQPEHQRRLVARLLEHNRAFVDLGDDRVDTLTNYPFNAERMQRLIKLVLDALQERAGYAPAATLKELVDLTDLGGRWLSPELLADILRRNGPFEVLAPAIVALKDLQLPSILTRSARQALRELGEVVTLDEVLRVRPDLAPFRECVRELLRQDPLVQSPDGRYFVLA